MQARPLIHRLIAFAAAAAVTALVVTLQLDLAQHYTLKASEATWAAKHADPTVSQQTVNPRRPSKG